MFGPLPIFWGGHLNFLRATYYHQWNTILYAFFYKSWTCPYNMQGPSYIALKFRGSASSPVQIGRSLRKQGEVIDCCIQKTEKNSLWSDFSLIEIKKNTQEKTVTDQTATCFPSWEIWLVNLKYTWSCCHCILSICLQVSTYLKSLVSLIYCRPEPFQVKMLRNSAYTKERKVSR